MTDLPITPTSLKARREAMGVSRELIASFGPPGSFASHVRDQERAKFFRVPRWHIKAVETIEQWMAEHSGHIIGVIMGDATEPRARIDDRPVLWSYAEPAFLTHCELHKVCLDRVDLYAAMLQEARAELIEAGLDVIDAEFLPDRYDRFREELGILRDLPEHRAKWWRHWSEQFKVVE